MVKKKVKKRIKTRKGFVDRFPLKRFSASGRPARAFGGHAIRDPIQLKKKR